MEHEFSKPSLKQVTYTVDSDTDLFIPQKKNGALPTATPTVLDSELVSACACVLSEGTVSLEDTAVSKRKRKIFSNVNRTETYLRDRRIPELISFILAKVMCSKSHNVASYVEKLLDECMMYRSGYGKAPVLFKERHIEAIVKSFDPGNRGWLSAGQVRRAYATLGLTPKRNFEVKTPTTEVLRLLRETQENELFNLLAAGSEMEDEIFDSELATEN